MRGESGMYLLLVKVRYNAEMNVIYLDNSATTPLKKEVFDAMLPFFMDNYGNAGSMHSIGQQARNAIDNAREIIASYFNCAPAEIIFTSGGSESNNLAIKGASHYIKERAIISTKIEHSSITKTLAFLEEEGRRVFFIPVNEKGHLSLTELEKMCTTNNVGLITLSFANSELGTLFPIEEIGKLCVEKGILFHVDALQAVNYIPIDVQALHIDLLSIGAHKIHGPKGIGMLYVKKGVKIAPLIHGGSQEYDLRAGTENTPAIVGLGKAVELLLKERQKRYEKVKQIRDFLEEGILRTIEGTFVNGDEPRLPNMTNIVFQNVPADSLIYRLDTQGIAVSAGTACTSGSLRPSEVLLGIGLDEETARSSLRFSVSETQTREEMEYVMTMLAKNVQAIRTQRNTV